MFAKKVKVRLITRDSEIQVRLVTGDKYVNFISLFKNYCQLHTQYNTFRN